jgi:Family of unknown function (DUF5681)
MTDSDDPAEETPRRYRNPPVEHRFRKGVSGNPRGRPRKSRALVSTKIGGQPGIGFEDRIKSLAIEEAYRPITIREGDRVERVPIIQAILRKVAVAAANGNTRAQQNYLTFLIGAEADRRMATTELFASAVEYKEHWGRVLAERARSGATGPEPVPHPDDIIIDSETGEVRFDGPVLEEQKAAQKSLRAMWPELERGLMQIHEQLESDPKNSELRKQQRDLAEIVDWLRDDAQKRTTRDALRFTGRLTPDEKAEWDSILKHRDTIQGTFDDFAGRMETQPRKKKILKKILLHIQGQFDLFNNYLPMRYQTTLKNRIVR